MDEETQKIYQEGETVSDYVKTKAWKIVKQKITDKILDLQSVMNIDFGSEKSMHIEVKARQLAVAYFYELLRDIEGQAAQHDGNKELLQDGIKII